MTTRLPPPSALKLTQSASLVRMTASSAALPPCVRLVRQRLSPPLCRPIISSVWGHVTSALAPPPVVTATHNATDVQVIYSTI